MDDHTFKAVVISNTVLMTLFVIQKIFDYTVDAFRKKGEKQESTVDDLVEKISELNANMSALNAEVQILIKYVFKVPQIEKDLNALSNKIREQL